MARRPKLGRTQKPLKPTKQPTNVPKGMGRMNNPYTRPNPKKRIVYTP